MKVLTKMYPLVDQASARLRDLIPNCYKLLPSTFDQRAWHALDGKNALISIAYKVAFFPVFAILQFIYRSQAKNIQTHNETAQKYHTWTKRIVLTGAALGIAAGTVLVVKRFFPSAQLPSSSPSPVQTPTSPSAVQTQKPTLPHHRSTSPQEFPIIFQPETQPSLGMTLQNLWRTTTQEMPAVSTKTKIISGSIFGGLGGIGILAFARIKYHFPRFAINYGAVAIKYAADHWIPKGATLLSFIRTHVPSSVDYYLLKTGYSTLSDAKKRTPASSTPHPEKASAATSAADAAASSKPTTGPAKAEEKRT